MTALEQRFMDSAIAFFNRNRKQIDFIELTKANDTKMIINKSEIVRVAYDDGGEFGALVYIKSGNLGGIKPKETYDEIKAMLGL